MKKLFALLAVALGVVACQKDQADMGVNLGGEQEAFITVNLPEVSRAGSEFGAFENGVLNTHDLRYILEIYYGENCYRQVQYTNEKSASFPVRLAPGRAYNFVVWADFVEKDNHADLFYKTSDGLDEISILNGAPMTEARDAFYGNYTLAADKHVANMDAITLTRPFAKIRVVTTDVKDLTKVGVALPTNAKVTYQTPINNKFNALTGEASNNNATEEYTFIYANSSYTDAEGEMTLFADYLFVNAGATTKFVLTVTDHVTKSFNTEIPVVANQVTTIKGDILTNGSDINVEVNPDFGGGNDWPDENNDAEKLAYAAMFGGEVTLTEDVALTQPLTIVDGAKVVINLNGKTITTNEEQSGRHHYAILNNGTLSLNGNGAINARGIKNFGTMTVDGDLTIKNVDTNGGAAIWNEGELTINNGTFISSEGATSGSYGAALNTRAGGKAVVNGGTFEAYSYLTYAIVNEGETTIYDAIVKGKHGAVAGAETNDHTAIYGGTFELMENPGVSDHCTYYVSAICGGTFSLGNNTDSGAKVFYESTIAAGYKALAAGGIYYVLPETIANAAEAENVTAVTESTADVATALDTNNGEATLFMWNDVAYIAKYGKVVIISDADEATTVRGVVEGSTGLTSATVAEGIEVVGNRTFRKCANLETVALPNTLTEIGPAVFQSCSKLANITIPESVTTIGEGAFAECTALTSINIPAGITRLEKDVLRNTGLVSVEIPASVNYIGTYAFRDCESLTEIKILSPEFTIENNTFTNTAAPVPTMTIHVVNAEMKAYLESVLTNYDKSYITVVGPTYVRNADELKAAIINGGNIEFANDITVDEWIMFSEDLNVATGDIITVENINVSIDGKGHTLTVNAIESAGNNDQLFQGASVLNISNLTLKYADSLTSGGLGMHSGVIKNVHFIGGGSAASSAAIFPNNGKIKVEDCIFDTNGVAFYFEDERDNLTVTRCTFNQKADKNVILLRGDVKFTDNTINSGRTVNVVSGSPVVTGNNFNNVRFKVYSAATATISNNIINNLEIQNATYASTFTANTLSSEAQSALNAATKVN